MHGRDSDKAAKTMNEDTEALVTHPRFGSEPRASGYRDAVAAAYKDWGGEYFCKVVFPESAIRADPAKQNHSFRPRRYYVDMKKTCRDCHRSFLFFAEEQRYWYEELGFPLAADCVRCPECRKANRIVRVRFSRYSQNVTKDVLDDDSLATLVDDAVFLWERSILKDMQKIYRLRKVAWSRIPDHEATRKINTLIKSQRSRDEG